MNLSLVFIVNFKVSVCVTMFTLVLINAACRNNDRLIMPDPIRADSIRTEYAIRCVAWTGNSLTR